VAASKETDMSVYSIEAHLLEAIDGKKSAHVQLNGTEFYYILLAVGDGWIFVEAEDGTQMWINLSSVKSLVVKPYDKEE